MPRVLAFTTVLTSACSSLAQWVPIAEAPSGALDIFALGADTVVVSGFGGGMMRTTDGGESWQSYQVPFTGSVCETMDFPTPTIGYLGGGGDFEQQILMRTVDGGITWAPLNNEGFSSGSIEEVGFLNADTGFFSEWALRRTLDGGLTSTIVPLGNYVHCTAIAWAGTTCFFGTRNWLGGDTGEICILKSQDLMQTWDTLFSEFIPVDQAFERTINRMQFVDADHGFAVGNSGTFFKTSDGGHSWTVSTIGSGDHLTDLSFISPTNGWVANGRVLRTVDGGGSWVEQELDTTETIKRLHIVDAQVGYAISYGRIFRTGNGGGPNSLPELFVDGGLLLHPNPAGDQITVVVPGRERITGLIAVDMMGRMMPLKLNDGSIADLSALCEGSYVVIARTTSSLFRATIIISR